MKRVFIAILPVLLVSGCSTENQQNQQVTAAQPLAQPVDPNQPAQVDPNTAQTQVAATTPASGTKVLTASEIHSQFIGVKMKWTFNPNTRFNGTTVFNLNNTITRWSKRGKSSGQWRMDGDKLCNFFPPIGVWKGIPWRCDPVIRDGDKILSGEYTYTKA